MEVLNTNTGLIECVTCAGCPYLVGAMLYDDWTKVDVVFTQNIIFPSGQINASPELCQYYFSGELTALFGDGYECSIVAATLTISFGTNAAFMSTSSLPVIAGRLKVASCTCSYDTTIAITSSTAVSLSAIVSPIASPVPVCTPLTISLSNLQGVGRRPLTLITHYTLSISQSYDASYPRTASFSRASIQLGSYLSSVTGTSFTIPAFWLLESGSYTLAIQLQNFAATYSASVSFTTVAYSVPTLSFGSLSSLVRIRDWDSLSIVPYLTFPGCDTIPAASAGWSYSFLWGQEAGGFVDEFNATRLQELYSTSNGILQFPQYGFLPERTHLFELNVTHNNFPVLLSLSVRVVVQLSDVFSFMRHARIDSGKDFWRGSDGLLERDYNPRRDSLA